MISLW
jgi:hypothetical protein